MRAPSEIERLHRSARLEKCGAPPIAACAIVTLASAAEFATALALDLKPCEHIASAARRTGSRIEPPGGAGSRVKRWQLQRRWRQEAAGGGESDSTDHSETEPFK